MAPIRRYLRITKYSVLEVRIYLDNPSLVTSWLLHPLHPILPRVIESVRPLVLPKLKEENARDRSRAKGGRKRGVKDVVVEDDFEVSIFLTETSTRHSLLTKQKHFREREKGSLKSNSKKLTGEGEGASNEEAIPIDSADSPNIPTLQESDDDAPALADIPFAPSSSSSPASPSAFPRRSKRQRTPPSAAIETDPQSSLFITSDNDDDDGDDEPGPKRARGTGTDREDDDKKKMAMDTSYEGFSIYGKVLCLIVRKGGRGARRGVSSSGTGMERVTMMEEWIASTQIPVGEEDEGL